MNQRRIILSVTNDLVTDQRVHRACMALHEAGYMVTLVGRRNPPSALRSPLSVHCSPYRTVRMRLLFRKKALFYAEYNIRLFLLLLFSKADAFYSNDTDTLLACHCAAVLRRKPLFFDAHEMFPEVPELVGRPKVKRFWSSLEDRLFPKLNARHRAAVTVCRSIADIYLKRYNLKMDVVRNVPMQYPEADSDVSELMRHIPEDKKILLYQGAVNVGRGIEWVMDAMPLLPDCHMVVAGTGDLYDSLRQKAASEGLEERVTFLGRLAPAQLQAFTHKASLGLSLLENRGLNYYYSLPNRIADFVQAGVPVLATDFPEIHNVVEGYGIGTLVPPVPFDSKTQRSDTPDPHATAAAISEALRYWEQMPEEIRRERFKHAAEELSWQHDKKILLHAVDTIF